MQRECIAQGGVTKLKEYMRGLNILPHKRKRKLPPDGIPRSPCTKLRSPRSPDGTLPGRHPDLLMCASSGYHRHRHLVCCLACHTLPAEDLPIGQLKNACRECRAWGSCTRPNCDR